MSLEEQLTLLDNKFVPSSDSKEEVEGRVRLIKLQDIPEFVEKTYNENPSLDKNLQPVLLSHNLGYRASIDSFISGSVDATGSFIFIDLDNINRPNPGLPNIADWCIENRNKLFKAFGESSNIAALQKSASGNLHIIIYSPYNSKNEFDSKVGILAAAFARTLYQVSGKLIDLRYPVQNDKPILDSHNFRIIQPFGLSKYPFYVNDSVNNFIFGKEDINKLRNEYPECFTEEVKSIEINKEDLNIKVRTKSLKNITPTEGAVLHYEDRYRIANTLAAVGYDVDEITDFIRKYSNDSDIKGIAKCSQRKFKITAGSLHWLKEQGVNITTNIARIDDDFFKDINCPVTNLMKEVPTVVLKPGQYLNSITDLVKVVDDPTIKRIEVYADCGTGKTEFCFSSLKDQTGDLVVPMNSTLHGKHSNNVEILKNVKEWKSDTSQTYIFDKLVSVPRLKDITFIDEHHLLTEQQDFRSVCFDIHQLVNEKCDDKIVIMTGTPYEFTNANARRFHVTKEDGLSRELDLHLVKDCTKAMFETVSSEIDKGNLVLLPTNKGLEKLKNMIVEKYGASAIGEYRRDRSNGVDVKKLNEDNMFNNHVKVLFCTSYLNVGCELKNYNNVVTVVNLSRDKFTGQQLHQFANRVRECDHKIIAFVKNDISLMTYKSGVTESQISDEQLVELMSSCSTMTRYIKSQYYYFDDDLSVDSNKKSFQLHNQALMEYYGQFPVVIKYMIDMGYKVNYFVDEDNKNKYNAANDNTKDKIVAEIKKDPLLWLNQYRNAMMDQKVIYGEKLELVAGGFYTTPLGNYTNSLCNIMYKFMKMSIDIDNIIKIFDIAKWSVGKLNAYYQLFSIVDNEDTMSVKLFSAINEPDPKERANYLGKITANLTRGMNKDTAEIIKRYMRYVARNVAMLAGDLGEGEPTRDTIVKLLSEFENSNKAAHNKNLQVYDNDGVVAEGSIKEVCEKMHWSYSAFANRSNKEKYKGYEVYVDDPQDLNSILTEGVLNSFDDGFDSVDLGFFKK